MRKGYVLERILYTVFIFFIVITLNFFIPRIGVEDPAERYYPPQGNLTDTEYSIIKQLTRKQYGFDVSGWQQYLRYLSQLSRGDLGTSLQAGSPKVSTLIAQRLPWTLVLSRERSSLEGLARQFPTFNLFARRRFLEVVAVPDAGRAMELLRSLPRHPAFRGIDGVQSIGLAITDASMPAIVDGLVRAGVHRILPLGDMFMRGAVEPYDGVPMTSLFTRIVYWRMRNDGMEGQL